ncbi:MAG: sigma-54 dependent transcriptional regulator [Pirellulaceae bacterium]|nr:sigma-54 dependent transcriptional regulator [Pirellulaceae bacterium]
MDRFHRLLLDVWREACRHIEIGEALDRIAPLLRQQLPAETILLRQLALDRQQVETVAVEVAPDGQQIAAGRTDCQQAAFDALVQWCTERRLEHAEAQELQAAKPGLLPDSLRGDVLAAGLASEHGIFGVLLLATNSRRHFRLEHEHLVASLQEPFTVALENDRRLQELVTLRERAEAENRTLLSKLGRSDKSETVVGVESGLREVMERVALVSRADVPVLILGETGSGKEVVARAIHRQSRRGEGPFLRVNCGAIPPELVDSELFGHEKGSFTGATSVRKGWFERADGGTLFLDECGELTPAAQVRLLRVLQDGSFERVGGEKQLHVDVRVVAATHRDLKGMVAERTFREDLWYRLAVFPVHLPPLRERIEDIPAMASHFAARAAAKFGLRACLPSDADIRQLVSYAWPGNVRELSAVMERAAILGNGQSLDVATALGHPVAGAIPTAVKVIPPARGDGSPPLATLDAAMREHIETALRQTGGQIEGKQGAAKLLGINPHTLRARMRKLGIAWREFREQE